ncbi:DUF4921 family protein [Corynebacterium liangguodongii]|uniref:DUF4921 domain-containing protein n=1 Tax=Corynebacterium liangguodongii TaxID=2079535 RepID=A0A2S0WES0_9CORY|nr:DUF4921 family protein [Corynebacterium liangguodongii]AWB84277.1 DUF4921 domain-containing protein [Corynebacterium liangguodongii]PWC00286.1 DUF4921 domain-containing protein [Corynebacterium liangguodongii]
MTLPVLTTMADGTIKQINPFSGTEVWMVPGRGNRPLMSPPRDVRPLGPGELTDTCNFCQSRPLATPPEKSRIVKGGTGWDIQRDLLPDQLGASVAEFRRVPNLFEIVSYDYWSKNYGYEMPSARRRHMERYLGDPAGRAHVLDIVRTRLRASGLDASRDDASLLAHAPAYFAGGHDVIIARRHFSEGASDTSQLASSGTLTPEEHYAYIALTIDAMRDLYDLNRYVPYVAVFQNWLSAAGASFDHLHKQLVAIDERGVQSDTEIATLRRNPNMYNEWGVNYAFYNNLVIAENDHAILIAGIGHRYPTVSIYSTSATCEPWKLSEEEARGFSDLLHAAHAATGAGVASNEEWHHKPIDLDMPMPLRVNLKWRVSTLAGFEGGTKIYVNTLSPHDIRDRMVASLYQLREAGAIAPGIRIATECRPARNVLRYNPWLRASET